MTERKEAWMRILVAIVSGIVIAVWGALIRLISFIQWLIVVFSGKRNKGLAEFCEPWNTQLYVFVRYLTFMSNERPFPWRSLEKNISKYK